MIKDEMLLPLSIDQANIKATTAAFLTQPDSAILPYTIGFVPWEWIEKSTKYRKMSSGVAIANPNNVFIYSPSNTVLEQTKGVPFVYSAKSGSDNGYMGVYDSNGTYTRLPFAGNTNNNLSIIHSYNTEYYTTLANAGLTVNGINLQFFGYETISINDGWQGNTVASVKPIISTQVNAIITPLPEIALTFSQNINSPYGGDPYTITSETLNSMDERGIMRVDGGTVDISGVTYNKTLYLFIRAIDLNIQYSPGQTAGFGVCIMDKARLGATSLIVYNQYVNYFELTSAQNRTGQFIFGDVDGISLEYPSPYGYYISAPENSQCVFRYAAGNWVNVFISGGMTWYDILIMLLTALPAYKIGGSWYCAEFDDDFQLTGKFVEFENAREWQKNINPDDNTFDFNDIPVPEPPEEEAENIGDKITRPASIGIGGTNGFVTQYALDKTDVAQLGDLLWTSFVDQDYWQNYLFSLAVDTGSFSLSSLLNFFVSLKVYPFSLVNIRSFASWGNNMYIGTGVVPLHFTNSLHTINNYADYISGGTITIPRYFNDYRDYINTEITLYLPFCGTVHLNPGDVIGNKIKIQYAIDFATGGCIAYVDLETGDGAGYPVGAMPGQIGADIPLTATAAGEVAARFIGDAMNVGGLISGEVGGIAKGVAGAMGGEGASGSGSGSTFAGIAGVYGGIGAAMGADLAPGFARQELQMLRRGAVSAPMLSGGRGFASFGAPAKPYVQIRRGIYPTVSGLATVDGKPAAGTYEIGQLSGFVQGSVKTDGLTCPENEKIKIKNLIASGIYV